MSRQKVEKWYCYRRDRDGMEVRRDKPAPWLVLKGYKLKEVVKIETKDVKGA